MSSLSLATNPVLGLTRADIELYGDNMAKVKLETLERLRARPNAKYILMTAITPTPLVSSESLSTAVCSVAGEMSERSWTLHEATSGMRLA